MNHLGAASGSENVCDVARIVAANAVGMRRVVGDKPSPDLDPLLIADRDTVATFEYAFNTGDSGRQQACGNI